MGLYGGPENNYNHPYKPYEIQKEFMNSLYEVLQDVNVKVAIFESPTGTGKTLSLLCPSITWLRNSEYQKLQDDLKKIESSTGPKWAKESAKQEKLEAYQAKAETLKRIRSKPPKKYHKLGQNYPKKAHTGTKIDVSQSEDYLLRETLVDRETDSAINELVNEDNTDLSGLVQPIKIFFTSRTHSQLSQFVGSLKDMKLGACWSDQIEQVKHVSLGSRKQLCIHPAVKSLSSVNLMNDKCIDLQRSNQCEFRSHDEKEFVEETVNTVMDIEDLGNLGSELKSCPYYGSRASLPYAEVVTLPYQLLVHERNRSSLNIDIENSVVIIDEAHNLIDTIASLNSSSVTAKDVEAALHGLDLYQKKVGARLGAKNSRKLSQVVRVLKSLQHFFELSVKQSPKPGTPVDSAQLFTTSGADVVDLWSLHDWFEESKLVFKVDGYLRQSQQEFVGPKLVLGKVIDFLMFATDPTSVGKLFYDKGSDQGLSLTFLDLEPSSHFADVVEKAAKVVLAGGTMEPVDEYVQSLFPYLETEEIRTFSYGHIVSSRNYMVRVVESFQECEFEFTFAKRNNPEMIKALGELIKDLASRIPHGIVVFFPSYSYLDQVCQAWEKCGVKMTQKVFKEDSQHSVESILSEYTKEINTGKGAIMFAVVGGKLSEGINFSDNLARGVIMVGLPFPNAFSAEMVAKRQHIEKRALSQGLSVPEATQKVRDYYENLSMRATNQSIGRAIRHINDYSAIYLVDKRFAQPRIKNKLSAWMRGSVSSRDYRQDTDTFFSQFRSA